MTKRLFSLATLSLLAVAVSAFQTTYDTSLWFHSDLDDSGVYSSSDHTEQSTELYSAPSLRGSEDTSDESLVRTADSSEVVTDGTGQSSYAAEDTEVSMSTDYTGAASSDTLDGTTNNTGADGASSESITYGSVDGSSVDSVDYSADTETSVTLSEGAATGGTAEISDDSNDSTRGSYVSETLSYDSGSDASNGATEFVSVASGEARTIEATNAGSQNTSAPTVYLTEDASDEQLSGTLSHDSGTAYTSENTIDPSRTHPSVSTDKSLENSAAGVEEGRHAGVGTSRGGTTAVMQDSSDVVTYDSRTPNTSADANQSAAVSSGETGQGLDNSSQGRTGEMTSELSGHSGDSTVYVSSTEGPDSDPSLSVEKSSHGGTDTHSGDLSRPTEAISVTTAETDPSAPVAGTTQATQEADTNAATGPTVGTSEATQGGGGVSDPSASTAEGSQATDTDQTVDATSAGSEGTRVVSVTEATDNSFAATTQASDPLARNAAANEAYKRRALIEAAAYEAITQLPALLAVNGSTDYVPSEIVRSAIRLIDPQGAQSLVESMVAILDEYKAMQRPS